MAKDLDPFEMTPTEKIFAELDARIDTIDISEEETRAAVGELIAVLKKRNITYDCAEMLLKATRSALSEMSRSLRL